MRSIGRASCVAPAIALADGLDTALCIPCILSERSMTEMAVPILDMYGRCLHAVTSSATPHKFSAFG